MFNSTAPFDLKMVIDRLKPLMPEHIKHLGSTAEYSALVNISQAGLATPAVYVVPNAETAHLGEVATRQMVTVSFSVIVIVQSYQYNYINPQLNITNPIIAQIRERLMGWIPPIKGAKETFFMRGEILNYTNTYLVWMETFQTKMIIGKSKQ